MSKTRERELYDPIIIGARYEGIILCRISDSAYSGKKPFDIFGISKEGIGIAMEVKYSEKSVRVSTLIKNHQLSWIKEYGKRKAFGIVALKISIEPYLDIYKVNAEGILIFLGKLKFEQGIFTGLSELLKTNCP